MYSRFKCTFILKANANIEDTLYIFLVFGLYLELPTIHPEVSKIVFYLLYLYIVRGKVWKEICLFGFFF